MAGDFYSPAECAWLDETDLVEAAGGEAAAAAAQLTAGVPLRILCGYFPAEAESAFASLGVATSPPFACYASVVRAERFERPASRPVSLAAQHQLS